MNWSPTKSALVLQRMTKLMEWVTVGVLGLMLWISAYSGVALLSNFRTEILWSPVVLVFILGVYSVLTIAYRCSNHYLSYLHILFTSWLFKGRNIQWLRRCSKGATEADWRGEVTWNHCPPSTLAHSCLFIDFYPLIKSDHLKNKINTFWHFREDLRNKGFDFSQ